MSSNVAVAETHRVLIDLGNGRKIGGRGRLISSEDMARRLFFARRKKKSPGREAGTFIPR